MDQPTSECQGRVIATRSFQTDTGGAVVASLFEPTRLGEEQWACGFRIAGLQRDLSDRAYGVDSMQALMMAFEGIRVYLESSGATLTWLDGEPGSLGLARTIPFSYGLKVQKHLTKVLEDELTQLIETDAKAKGRPDKT